MAPKISMKTRKPVNMLTPRDMEGCLVWEYALDEEDVPGQDETWVKPTDRTTITKGLYSQIVAADFLTNSGIRAVGFMIVTTAQKVIEIRPGVILLGKQYCPIESSEDKTVQREPWYIKRRQDFCAAFDLPDSKVFPIQFTLRVLIQKEKTYRTGTIP